jgi:hypothetical protein
MDKKVHIKIEKGDDGMTLRQVLEKISEIQDENPDREVFFDGDEYAICSRPKK